MSHVERTPTPEPYDELEDELAMLTRQQEEDKAAEAKRKAEAEARERSIAQRKLEILAEKARREEEKKKKEEETRKKKAEEEAEKRAKRVAAEQAATRAKEKARTHTQRLSVEIPIRASKKTRSEGPSSSEAGSSRPTIRIPPVKWGGNYPCARCQERGLVCEAQEGSNKYACVQCIAAHQACGIEGTKRKKGGRKVAEAEAGVDVAGRPLAEYFDGLEESLFTRWGETHRESMGKMDRMIHLLEEIRDRLPEPKGKGKAREEVEEEGVEIEIEDETSERADDAGEE